eukprot:TRINITY_DN30600_c0_g1_i1.p1 TRINITY_DN30600_c0_g1~~TRINITY_DN30600_c0_g1_i1.p1  ORF type:complete len:457 (+),score=55.48 TRINITY_DN30600_c0_g1_i1:186-1373(+)
MADRDRLVKRFNHPEAGNLHCFLLSVGAGGVGLNIMGATRVVLLGPSWNPTVDDQAVYRTYRFGQDRPVHVYRLITQGSVDEIIWNHAYPKTWLGHKLLDGLELRRVPQRKSIFGEKRACAPKPDPVKLDCEDGSTDPFLLRVASLFAAQVVPLDFIRQPLEHHIAPDQEQMGDIELHEFLENELSQASQELQDGYEYSPKRNRKRPYDSYAKGEEWADEEAEDGPKMEIGELLSGLCAMAERDTSNDNRHAPQALLGHESDPPTVCKREDLPSEAIRHDIQSSSEDLTTWFDYHTDVVQRCRTLLRNRYPGSTFELALPEWLDEFNTMMCLDCYCELQRVAVVVAQPEMRELELHSLQHACEANDVLLVVVPLANARPERVENFLCQTLDGLAR